MKFIHSLNLFRASVIDIGKESLVIQITGESNKIEAFIEFIKPYGIKELARTGTTAFARATQMVQTKEHRIIQSSK